MLDYTEFQNTILNHYWQNKRDFPWRQTQDPYHILVSEIMLQQTQTERVVEKYTQWLSELPTLESVAQAPLTQILSLWSGLGYNRRARFLHEACKTIVSLHGGRVPSDVDQLDNLPGVGPYTARAVATFAYNKDEVFIETNIRSVYIFFFFSDAQIVHDKQLLPLIAETLYHENPRIWYYALMDYGASLKKKVKNPNRKSQHYNRQSKFKGSLRQARGAILRQLTLDQHEGRGLTLEQIAQSEKIDYDRLKIASESLCAEKFIYCEDFTYRIT